MTGSHIHSCLWYLPTRSHKSGFYYSLSQGACWTPLFSFDSLECVLFIYNLILVLTGGWCDAHIPTCWGHTPDHTVHTLLFLCLWGIAHLSCDHIYLVLGILNSKAVGNVFSACGQYQVSNSQPHFGKSGAFPLNYPQASQTWFLPLIKIFATLGVNFMDLGKFAYFIFYLYFLHSWLNLKDIYFNS